MDPKLLATADRRATFALVAMIAMGAFCIVLAAREWHRERRLRKVGHRTHGVVTRLRWSAGNAYPVFAFQAPDGRTVEVKSNVGTSPPLYRGGETVRVLYDPADPEHAHIDRTTFGMGRVVLCLSVGIGLFAFGLWLLRGTR